MILTSQNEIKITKQMTFFFVVVWFPPPHYIHFVVGCISIISGRISWPPSRDLFFHFFQDFSRFCLCVLVVKLWHIYCFGWPVKGLKAKYLFSFRPKLKQKPTWKTVGRRLLKEKESTGRVVCTAGVLQQRFVSGCQSLHLFSPAFFSYF